MEHKSFDGNTILVYVPVLDYALGRLPRYKAQGPDGMRYEHILAMPTELVELLTTHAVNGALPEDYKPIFRSGM